MSIPEGMNTPSLKGVNSMAVGERCATPTDSERNLPIPERDELNSRGGAFRDAHG